MRKLMIIGGLVATMALPLMAVPNSADAASCHSRKTTGTILGGVGGALLGNAVSHGGGGAVVGGLGGAVVGHEIGRAGCRPAYRTSSYRRDYRRNRDPYAANGSRQYYDQYGHLVTVR